jgi:hypothetical protein
MKKSYLQNCIIACFFIIILSSAVAYESGASGGYSNAPGESSCTSCHSGTLITTNNANLQNIQLKPHFTKGGYEIDSTYEMELTFKQSNISSFGFEITCLNSSTNLAEGTFSVNNNRVRLTSTYIAGKKRDYVVQTTTGSSPVATDSTRWVFKWKAPASNNGKVKYYVTINAANNDGKDGGDIIYAKTFEFPCANALPVATAGSSSNKTCTNYDVNFTGSGTNATTSYSWKFTGANPSTSNWQNPTVKFTQAGTQYAILTAKNSSGNSLPDTFEIQVDQSPGASILNGYSGSVCKGDSLQITSNNSSILTHLWSPNGETNKSIFVKDVGAYTVTNTSTINGCKGTSLPFFLSHYDQPSLSISTKIKTDSTCGNFIDKIRATGHYLDSVIWYVNGQVYARGKDSSLSVNFDSDVTIQALGKSVNGCQSALSNSIHKTVVKKRLPYNYTINKSSSNISLHWSNRNGVDSVQYSITGFNYQRAVSDTAVILDNLNSNTFYNIFLRTYQKSPCSYVDTIISIKTNNCSGLVYNVESEPRICKGNPLKITITGLYKTRYSLSFQGAAFDTDTIFTIQPTQSDSFSIKVYDSLSSNCPPITDKIAYYVDTLPLESTLDNNVYSCSNHFVISRSADYENYEFYKNNSLLYSGDNRVYLYNNLNYGDTLISKASVKACSSVQETVFKENLDHTAEFNYSRDHSNYTFVAKDSQANIYKWYINNVLAGQSNPFISNLNAYSNQNIQVILKTQSNWDCNDSFSQQLQLPKFSSIQNINSKICKVYPNPSEQFINIDAGQIDNLKFELCSSNGQIILDGEFDKQIKIDLKELNKGIYILKVYNSELIEYQVVVFN